MLFIIGCGRSGTTILGNTLGLHPKISYLNEPRDIWIQAYPYYDIWSLQAESRQGKLLMNEADYSIESAEILYDLFEKNRKENTLLVEKLPINSFRLKFLKKHFPQSQFLHIKRNGINVAASIEKYAARTTWFGHNDFKWNLLKSLSNDEITSLCSNNFYRGLLEWKLALDSIYSFDFKTDEYLEISYENLISNPKTILKTIFQFINVSVDSNQINDLAEKILLKENKTTHNYNYANILKIASPYINEYI